MAKIKRSKNKKSVRKKLFCVNSHEIAIVGRDKWGRCIQCSREASKLFQQEHKEELKPYKSQWAKQDWQKNKDKRRKANKSWRLLKYFNLTLEQYNLLLKEQKEMCAGCDKLQKDLNISLAVDHDHITGEVRGLLCSSCNWFLGYINENTEVLKKLIKYLNKHKEK